MNHDAHCRRSNLVSRWQPSQSKKSPPTICFEHYPHVPFSTYRLTAHFTSTSSRRLGDADVRGALEYRATVLTLIAARGRLIVTPRNLVPYEEVDGAPAGLVRRRAPARALRIRGPNDAWSKNIEARAARWTAHHLDSDPGDPKLFYAIRASLGASGGPHREISSARSAQAPGARTTLAEKSAQSSRSGQPSWRRFALDDESAARRRRSNRST